MLCLALSFVVSEINANLYFPRSCDLERVTWPKNEIFKNVNFTLSNPLGFQNMLHLALSHTVSEINANLYFRGNVTLRVTWPKKEILKIVNFIFINPLGFQKLLRLALSLTVSKIKANLNFQGHETWESHDQKTIFFKLSILLWEILQGSKICSV